MKRVLNKLKKIDKTIQWKQKIFLSLGIEEPVKIINKKLKKI